MDLDAFYSAVSKLQRPGILSLEDFADYLFGKYKSITIYNRTISFNDVVISDEITNDTLFVFFYINNLESFLTAMINSKSGVEKAFADIAEEIAYYYDLNTSISIIYTNVFSFYPSAFEQNGIYPNCIDYLGNNRWLVFYPYMNLYLDKTYNIYFTEWAY